MNNHYGIKGCLLGIVDNGIIKNPCVAVIS